MKSNDNSTTSDQEIFFEILEVPIYCNLLWPSSETARNCPKGDIKLAFDQSSGMIRNIAFDPSKLAYDQDYENSLHYSPRFQEYAQSLASDLVKAYQLQDKHIIEIGCGKGDFLFSLCKLGHNKGTGFDPTYVPRSEHQALGSKLQFIQDYYSERYSDYQADLIVCRHTLEHVFDPGKLLKPLRRAIGNHLHTAVFFEVPNGLDTFHQLAIWDIIYEHCCYYVPLSLVQVFNHYGFHIQKIYETYEEQFLCIEALPIREIKNEVKSSVQELQGLKADLDQFSERFKSKITAWEKKLFELGREEQRVILWGAGSKGVTFLNILQNKDVIDFIVDLNPRKQGKYVPGTGHRIVPPEFLREYEPDTVIVMNPIYDGEIKQMLLDLGCETNLISV